MNYITGWNLQNLSTSLLNHKFKWMEYLLAPTSVPLSYSFIWPTCVFNFLTKVKFSFLFRTLFLNIAWTLQHLLCIVGFCYVLHMEELLTFSSTIVTFYCQIFLGRCMCYTYKCLFRGFFYPLLCVWLDVINNFLCLLRVTLLGNLHVSL